MKRVYSLLKYFLFFPALIYILSFSLPDQDNYFLIAVGRDILQNKRIPTVNPFTHMHCNVLVQQWFVSVVNAVIFDNFGKIGLIVYTAFILLLTVFLSIVFLRLFTKNEGSETFTVFYIIACSFIFFNLRPSSMTMNILLILLIVLEKYKRTGKNIYLLLLPLISIIQINVHAAMWFLIFPFMCIYMLPSKIEIKITKKQIKLLIATIVSIFAGLINPNGKEACLYIFKSLGSVSFIPIGEMEHPAFFGYPGIVIIIAIILLTIYVYKKKKDIDTQKFLVALAGVICAIMYIRNTYMCGICLIPVISEIVFYRKKEKNKKEYVVGSIIFAVLMITIFIIFPPNTEIKDKESSAIAAFDYLDTKQNVKLFTGFNTGSYAEFRGYKVYLDGRAEIYGKNITGTKDYMIQYLKLCNGQLDINEFLEEYEFTHLIVSFEERLDTYLYYNDDYKLVIDTDEYRLYEKIK